MGSGLLVFFAFAAVFVVISVVGVVLALTVFSTEQRLLRRVSKLEPLLSSRPSEVRRECALVQAALRRASRGKRKTGLDAFPDDSKGLTAYAWSEILLAVLDRKDGKWTEADEHVNRVRDRFRGKDRYSYWLLRYYVLSGAVNSEGVKLLVESLSSESTQTHFPRQQLADLLRQSCRVLAGMPEDDARERVKWNRSAQSLVTEEPWPWIEESRGWCRLKSWQRAERSLDEAFQQFGELPEAQILAAQVQRQMGNSERAVQHLHALAANAKSTALQQIEAAEEFMLLDERSHAESVLNQLNTSDEVVGVRVDLIRARAMIRDGQKAEAIELLRGTGRYQKDIDSAALLATLHSERSEHSRAVEVLTPLVSVSESEPQYLWTLACAYWNVKDYESAATWFKNCTQVGYRQADSLLHYSRCLARLGRRDEAADALEELPEDEATAAAEAAFHRGIVLYDSQQPDKAFPHFVRAQKLASEVGNQSLVSRAGSNGIACYHALAKLKIKTGEFDQAGKAIERLQSYYAKKPAQVSRLTNSLAECHVRDAITHLDDRQNRDYAAATELILEALKLRPDGRLKGLLAGLYTRQNEFGNAAVVYDEILRANPKSSTAFFARALCLAQASDAGDLAPLAKLTSVFDSPPTLAEANEVGMSTLRAIGAKPGAFAVRSALTIAAEEAKAGRYTEAAHCLRTVLKVPGAAEDHFANQASCQLVLVTLRGGDVEMARQLAGELMGGEVIPELVIGILLAHDGDFDAALPYLEAGIPDDAPRTNGDLILFGVVSRLAAKLSDGGQYQAAFDMLARANRRNPSSEIRQFSELLKMTVEAGQAHTELDDKTVSMLTSTMNASRKPSTLLLRATTIAYQQLARIKVGTGKELEAQKLWEQSFKLLGHIQGNTSFWREFIQTYNEGKQYPLECSEDELEKEIFERIAGLNVLLVRDILESFKAPPRELEPDVEQLPVAEIISETPVITEAPVINTGDDYQLSTSDRIPCPNCRRPVWPAEISKHSRKCHHCR